MLCSEHYSMETLREKDGPVAEVGGEGRGQPEHTPVRSWCFQLALAQKTLNVVWLLRRQSPRYPDYAS